MKDLHQYQEEPNLLRLKLHPLCLLMEDKLLFLLVEDLILLSFL